MKKLSPPRMTAMLAPEASVTLTRSGSRIMASAASWRQPVPGASYGLDRRAAELPVDLVPQYPDVHVGDARVAGAGQVPDPFYESRARDELPRRKHAVSQ